MRLTGYYRLEITDERDNTRRLIGRVKRTKTNGELRPAEDVVKEMDNIIARYEFKTYPRAK